MRIINTIGLIFIATVAGFAQEMNRSRVIDDSTKQVYGPTTSDFFMEEDVFLNKEALHPIDTLIRNFNRFTPKEHRGDLYQDLGVIGTASQPLFFQPPDVLGASLGFNAYDLYWDNIAIRYFNTKSPYTNLALSLGGKGRSLTDVTYSRNINPRLNFGFDFRGVYIDKQMQRRGKGDRIVRRTYYDVFTTYQSKDSTYRLFFNFTRGSHETAENGGVLLDSGFTLSDFFGTNISPTLVLAQDFDFRVTLHLYQELRLARGFQLYHKADTYYQRVKFTDVPASEPDGYYDHVEVDSAFSNDITRFKTLRNEMGIKGSVYKFFYNGYVALRNYKTEYSYLSENNLPGDGSGSELYVGGSIALRLDSLLTLNGNAEYLPPDKFRIGGSLSSPWFDLHVWQVSYSPSFFYQAYRGSHDNWTNDFNTSEATEFGGTIKIKTRKFGFYPGMNFNVLHDYVFLKLDDYGQEQTVMPVQTSGFQTRVSPQVRLSLQLQKHVLLTSQVIYSKMIENAGDAIQVPEVIANGELSYQNILFKGNLDMQMGVDVKWTSSYFAPGYDVPTQHFFTQKVYEVGDYPDINVFFNGRIKRARIFFRYHNVLQAFNGTGYLATPFYPAQSNVIDFGFDWSFYD